MTGKSKAILSTTAVQAALLLVAGSSLARRATKASKLPGAGILE
jgi:hypothetical protein